MERRVLIGLAACGVLTLAAGGTVMLRSSGTDGTFSLEQNPFETPTPSVTPTASASFVFSMPPVPSGTPSATPTGSAEPTASPSGTAAPSPRPSASSPAGFPPYRARALPTGCLSFGHACTHSDAGSYAVTGGVEDLRCRLEGANGVRVTWRSVNLTGRDNMPPVGEFVVRLWRYPADERDGNPSLKGADRLYEVRVSRSTFDVSVRNLVAGERYACFVQELNLAGLSSAMGVYTVKIPGGASATPSATSTPSPTASPTADPTEDPTETPAP